MLGSGEAAARVDEPDLVVIAPRRGDDGVALVREAASVAGPGSVVVLVSGAARRRTLLRAATAVGFVEYRRFVHFPRLTVSASSAALRAALASLPRLGLRRRAAAVIARTSAWRVLLVRTTSTVLARGEAPSLLTWLEHDEADVVVRATGRADGTHVVLALGAGVVGKLGPPPHDRRRELDEWDALTRVAPGAAAAGVSVPAAVRRVHRGFVATALAGRPAAAALAEEPRRHDAFTRAVAAWIARWHAATATPGVLTHAVLERELREPARVLAADLGPGYASRLEELAQRAEGTEVPFVHAHGDLTTANVLVDGDALGVVDWASARTVALPLTDLFYALADARTAADGFRDRTDSFRRTFGDGAAGVRLAAAIADELALEPTAVEVAFHACWLHHAANEAERGGGPRVFLDVLRVAEQTVLT